MTKPQQKMFAISEQQLIAVHEFIGSLVLPWKQTNPLMQLLSTLPEVTRAQPEPEPEPESLKED